MERSVDMREAVRTAKQFVTEYFDDERITNVGLEEIKYDQNSNLLITIGFLRPWDKTRNAFTYEVKKERSYKVVRIGPDGTVKSLMDRLLPQ